MYKVYQIKVGDTIENIASRLGVSVSEIENLNGLTSPYNLTVGQFLVVPNIETFFSTYEVKKGDSIYELSQKYNIDYNQLLKLNGLNKDDYIYPGEKINVPSGNTKFYITNMNDTFKDVQTYLGKNPLEIINENESIYLMPDQIIYAKDN